MIYVIIISLLILGLDQLSKYIIVSNEKLHNFVVIEDFFRLYYTRNDGIAFSINVPLWILVIITVITIGIFLYFSKNLKIKKDLFLILTYGFILGGALGNFVDRIFQPDHSVVDFLAFTLYYPSFKDGLHFVSFPFAIFNVGDSFIVIGAILLIINVLFFDKEKEKHAN